METSMEVLISAGKFQNNIEVSNTICIVKFVQISRYRMLYVTYPVFSINISGLHGVILL